MSVFSRLFSPFNRGVRRGIREKICVTVEIRGYDEKGKLTGIRRKKSDLILDNFGKWLAGLIQDGSAIRTVSITNEAGASKTLKVYETTSISQFFNYATSGRGAFIAIGSGTTSPARGDYSLVTKEGEAGVNPASYLAGVILFSASIVLGASKTITESALKMKWNDSGAILVEFLLFRDTFAGVTGTQFTVQYTINL